MPLTRTNLLPPNATDEERALCDAVSLANAIIPEDIEKLARPYDVPAAFLPFLAWAFHVDFWVDTAPEETKRRYIAESWEWHRHKGTPFAIKRSLLALGFTHVTLREWFSINTPPHTFIVELYPGDAASADAARRSIYEYKPVRSHLICLGLRFIFTENLTATEVFKSFHTHVLDEQYPWPEMFYGQPNLYYTDMTTASENTPRYGIYEHSEKLRVYADGAHYGDGSEYGESGLAYCAALNEILY